MTGEEGSLRKSEIKSGSQLEAGTWLFHHTSVHLLDFHLSEPQTRAGPLLLPSSFTFFTSTSNINNSVIY